MGGDTPLPPREMPVCLVRRAQAWTPAVSTSHAAFLSASNPISASLARSLPSSLPLSLSPSRRARPLGAWILIPTQMRRSSRVSHTSDTVLALCPAILGRQQTSLGLGRRIQYASVRKCNDESSRGSEGRSWQNNCVPVSFCNRSQKVQVQESTKRWALGCVNPASSGPSSCNLGPPFGGALYDFSSVRRIHISGSWNHHLLPS